MFDEQGTAASHITSDSAAATPPERRTSTETPVATSAMFKAMAHPLRLQILEHLAARPMTASGLAAALGESSGSTSYHLRQLQRHGLIREDAARGTRRERWWTNVGPTTVTAERLQEDTAAARIVADSLIGRWHREAERYFAAVTERRVPDDVAEASAFRRGRLRLTPADMARLSEELDAVLRAWRGREGSQEAGTVPVIAQISVFTDLEETS